MTAYFGMFDIGNLKDGDNVVISGAAGSVGLVSYPFLLYRVLFLDVDLRLIMRSLHKSLSPTQNAKSLELQALLRSAPN
jgi:hypothetical protein